MKKQLDAKRTSYFEKEVDDFLGKKRGSGEGKRRERDNLKTKKGPVSPGKLRNKHAFLAFFWKGQKTHTRTHTFDVA